MAEHNNNVLVISSPAFENGGEIPSEYTCDGKGINPELNIEKIPDETQTLALIVEDPDAPSGPFDHWIVWNIPKAEIIKESINPGIDGKNSAGKTGYHPPCPPSGSHRYYFHVFALDITLDLTPGASKEELLEAMKPHTKATGSLMGQYKRKK